jgi:AcrR family transcriptional regulator
MDQAEAPESGWRGSREGWLEAGYQALIEGGIDAVKILPLAKQLKLSRTSFYWFFEDREALLAALTQMLVRWGHLPAEADIRARTVYLVQIGYISMQAAEDLETRLERIPLYVKIYAGREPEPREIARFNAGIRRSSG